PDDEALTDDLIAVLCALDRSDDIMCTYRRHIAALRLAGKDPQKVGDRIRRWLNHAHARDDTASVAEIQEILIEIDPHDPRARLALAELRCADGDLQAGLRHLRQAARIIAADDPRAANILEWR